MDKVAQHNRRPQKGLEYLTACHFTLEYSKYSANGNADFLSCLSLPSSENDHSGRNLHQTCVYLIISGGLSLDAPPTLSLGYGWLAPSSQSVNLSELPVSQSDFRDFRSHGTRMRIEDLDRHDDLDAPYREFVARTATSVFLRGTSWPLASSIQSACNLTTSSVFVVSVAPLLALARVGQIHISRAPTQSLVPLVRAGVGQKQYRSRSRPA